MFKFHQAFFMMCLTFALLGCSTFSKKDCETMDWGTKGYEAASNGQTAAGNLTYFQRECGAENGIQPNIMMFNKGYDDGLKSFCTADNGLRFGRGGGLYNNTCPVTLEKPFLEKYQLGRIEYTGTRIQELESQVSRLERENADKERRIKELQNRLNSMGQ